MNQEEIDEVFKTIIEANWVNEWELREQAHYGLFSGDQE